MVHPHESPRVQSNHAVARVPRDPPNQVRLLPLARPGLSGVRGDCCQEPTSSFPAAALVPFRAENLFESVF